MGNILFDAEKINQCVKPPLKNGSKNLDEAKIKVPTNKNMPQDFIYNQKLQELSTRVDEIKGSVDEIYEFLTEVTEKFAEVKIKNDKLLKQIFYDDGTYIDNTMLVNSKPIIEKNLGTFEAFDEPYIGGYYKDTNGRIASVCYQHYVTPSGRGSFFGSNWNNKCNRAAEATILSKYTEKSLEEIIQELNFEHGKGDEGPTIASNEFWAEYGLQATKQYWGMNVGEIGQKGTYTDELWTHLQETDGCAMVWLTTNNAYEGKSGEIWARNFNPESQDSGIHWVAVIDHRILEGQEQIAIANPGTGQVEWYDIDEFQHGISNMVLINEIIE